MAAPTTAAPTTAELTTAELTAARTALPPVHAPALILLALVLTWASPLWLLLLAPLVLGVPHVLGDLRCLVLQRPGGMGRAALAAILLPLLALTLLRTATLLGAGGWPRIEIACGTLAILGGVLVGTGRSVGLRALLLVAAGGLGVTACVFPASTVLLLAHAHNLVGFALFLGWTRDRRHAWWAGLAYGAAAAVLGLGLLPIHPGTTAANLDWTGMAQSLAPGLEGAAADRLVLTYAFAQAVHYAVWVWLIPRETSRKPLRAELGETGFWAAALLAVLVPAAALFDPAGVRSVYLSLALFHGWLELAVVAFLWSARRGAWTTSSPG